MGGLIRGRMFQSHLIGRKYIVNDFFVADKDGTKKPFGSKVALSSYKSWVDNGFVEVLAYVGADALRASDSFNINKAVAPDIRYGSILAFIFFNI